VSGFHRNTIKARRGIRICKMSGDRYKDNNGEKWKEKNSGVGGRKRLGTRKLDMVTLIATVIYVAIRNSALRRV